MKILIVGQWAWQYYEKAFSHGLQKFNIDVVRLSTSNLFRGYWGRVQSAIPIPSVTLYKLNYTVISVVKAEKPDFVLFWRPTHILPSTVKKLTSMGIKTISYNNDDPFGPKVHGNVPWHHHFLWYWYIKCLPNFSFNFFYRNVNCLEAVSLGAGHATVMLPYFIPWRDRPLKLSTSEKKRYEADIVFVGHYENDGRADSIRALIKSGLHVKIWGGSYWNHKVLGDVYNQLSPIELLEGDEYVKSLCGARVCLCFLSKLNRDVYTRRCFEIPACGKVLLAERTNELLAMFEEDIEACFFSSQDELVEKTLWLINNPEIRERIAKAGLNRVWKDRHDIESRVKSFLSIIGIKK